MTPTIDCRPAGAKEPGKAALRRAAKLAGISLTAFCVLIALAVAFKPRTAGSPATPAVEVTASPMPAKTASSPPSSATPPSSDTDGLDYLSLKAEAEEKLDGVLTDDHGVRYRDVHTKLSTLEDGGIVTFCGEENSRTPLGGYGGFQRFIASRSVATTQSQMEPAEFAQAWSQFCENAVEGPQVWF